MALLTEADLDGSNWLSFTTQPCLKELFDVLLDGNSKVAFVLGAGVSMGSGFPSWEALLTALTLSISDD
jgi:hypothetical protein